VIADSSTEATPSTTSPSPGMTSPGSTTTTSPFRSSFDHRLGPTAPSARQRRVRVGAGGAQRVGLRLAAPFGHRFGEVREEHGEPEPQRDLQREAEVGAAAHQVVRDEQQRREHRADLTTNMTGFLTITRGSSLRNASARPAAHEAGSREFLCFRLGACASVRRSPGAHQEVLDDRAERERREEGEARRRSRSTPTSRPAKSGVRHRERPGRRRASSCAARKPARASAGTISENRPISIAAERRVVPRWCRREAREGRAVVGGGRREGVEDLGEAVRPLVVEAGQPNRRRDRDRRWSRGSRAGRPGRQHRHLHLARPRSSCPGTRACAPPSARR
jgi:hypothetical protein